MSTDRKVALVTGGSTGIGLSICRRFLQADYTVLNLSHQSSNLEHDRLIDRPVDLTDTEQTREAVSELAAQHTITTVIHNAGVMRPNLIEDVEISDVDYLHRLHVNAAIILVQGAVPAMKSAGFGRIIIIGSRAMVGLETRTGYSATKAGQLGLVRTWALELGPLGITANLIAPGPIITDMLTEHIPENSEKAQRLAASIPVRRLGRPEDVAAAAHFLASPESSFITGQALFVCGGTSVGSLTL
ncbi:SDR family NAD(P)-dependent oxidoreductase [Elongatibacter sediminis]|uniref:SDR family NAD(P)-dependent oxidoreductase n=1 Tax=Elongatibacter sediminis TaxID=3119006 RepID=A0AAW9RFG2_9GAMM